MKTRIVIIAILLLMLAVLLSKNNEKLTNILLSTINPIKQGYQNILKNIEIKSYSYFSQKDSIQKLSKENNILKKQLLEEMDYTNQIKNIYSILPDLSHFPVKNISIIQTISYVKLNSFSQIILTKPKNLKVNKLYGLIQNNVVAGISEVLDNQLYGYLTSDKKCRFSVFIGKSKAPGIAFGYHENEMLIKFIPKWHKIKIGDLVVTSGLDNIFYADIPVGIVTSLEIQNSYTVAYIKTYSDIFHPKTFFLINNATPYLLDKFDSNRTKIEQKYELPSNTNSDDNSTIVENNNSEKPIISSIPSRIDQTQENIIEPKIVEENHTSKKKVKRRVVKKRKKKKIIKKRSTLDLF